MIWYSVCARHCCWQLLQFSPEYDMVGIIHFPSGSRGKLGHGEAKSCLRTPSSVVQLAAEPKTLGS